MERTVLAKIMQERVLRLGEVLKYTFELMNERFSSFFLLTLLVYLPVNFVLQYAVMQVDLSVTDIEILAAEMMDMGIVQIVLSFLELVAVLVTGVMIHSQVFGQEQVPFGTIFYRGVRGWVRASMSIMVVMLGMMMSILSMSMMIMLPGMGLLVLPLILLLVLLYYLMQCCCCNAAALRGCWGFRNVRYVSIVLKGYMKKALGYTAVVLLVSGGSTMILNILLNSMLGYISGQWQVLGVSVIFSTLFSIITVYGYAAVSLLFLNVEEKKRRDFELAKQRTEHSNPQ